MHFLFRMMALIAVLAPLFAAPAHAQAPERRFALVIGNSEYKAGRLPTAANDAGLVAETLRTAGFDVAGARDLDYDTLRRSIREFVDKVSQAGPEAVSFVYLAGYGLQLEGENYIVPVDATIARDEDIPLEAIRISDLTRALAGTQGGVKIIVVDAARQHPYAPAGLPLASGLALVDPDPGMLIAFNTAPGSVSPIEGGDYGAFSQALSEMIGAGGLGLDDVFARLRLRVNETTGGVSVPWYASKVARPFLFTEPTPDAPPPPAQVVSTVDLQSQSIRQFPDDQQAYLAALDRDTIGGYQDFIAAFPDSVHVRRIRALIAVRREAVMWRRTFALNTREAYWSYLHNYPQGAHVADCERRLAELSADYDPPPSFVPVAFADVPPPPPDEVVYLSQPQVVFDDPVFVPPPPVPAFFCPPRPPEFVRLPPPPPPVGAFFLPAPPVSFLSGPRPWVRSPTFVVAPPRPPVQRITINNTTIVNERPAAGLMSPALPGVVVSRANNGALRAPPPAPPAVIPVVHAGTQAAGGTKPHPGVAVLGTQVPPPPRVHAVAVTPATTPIPGTQHAPVQPGSLPALPGGPHPAGPGTATTTPGTPPHEPGLPGGPHPAGPGTATTTPGAPHEPGLPGGPHPAGPGTAATTPGAPLHVPPLPAGPHPAGPGTAATAPGGPHELGLPGGQHPTGPGATPGVPHEPPGQHPSGPAPGMAVVPPHGVPPAAHNPPPPVHELPPPHNPPPAPHVVTPAPVHEPPPAVHNAPPPPPVTHSPPPPPPHVAAPPATHAAPPQQQPGRRCVMENGREVCR